MLLNNEKKVIINFFFEREILSIYILTTSKKYIGLSAISENTLKTENSYQIFDLPR